MNILWLPGLLCDGAVWSPLDIPGTVADYGDARSIATMAERALAQAPAGPLAVAGHSMGGRVAFELLRLAPERVARVALLDTGSHPLAAGEAGEKERAGRLRLLDIARREGMRTMAADWAQGMVHPSRLGGPVFEAVLDMFERKTPDLFEAQIHALLNRPDAAPQLPGIACPALLLTGADDAWSPPAQHQAMADAMPNGKLVVVPRCGHMSTMEDPSFVRAALLEWLAL